MTDLAIEVKQDDDGRWIAEMDELNGVIVYGDTEEEAVVKVRKLAVDMMEDRKFHGESRTTPSAEAAATLLRKEGSVKNPVATAPGSDRRGALGEDHGRHTNRIGSGGSGI